MGQEIVYCFKCQKRIVSADYAKGLAYQLENNSCCSSCAVGVLDTLPPKDKELLLAKMFKATQNKQAATSTSHKVIAASPSASSTRRIPVSTPPRPEPQTPSNGIWIGVGVGIVAVVSVVAVSMGGSAPHEAPIQVRPAPRPPVTVIKDPGPSPEEQRRNDRAKEAIRAAKDFEIRNPDRPEEQVARWKAARLDCLQTGYESEADRETRKAEARAADALAKDLQALDRSAKDPVAKKEFKTALEALSAARSRHATPDWFSAVERLEREVRQQAGAAFDDVKAKALAARDRGAKNEVEAFRKEVARWGIPEYATDLESVLAAAWTPLFDGKSKDFFSPSCREFWVLEEGGACQKPGQPMPQSGQSREPYGDGEFRFRYFSQSVEQYYFSVRQETGAAVRVKVDGDLLGRLGNGDHELIILCRGSEITATLDGQPAKVETWGKLVPRGRIQFNCTGGRFIVRSIDLRPLQ